MQSRDMSINVGVFFTVFVVLNSGYTVRGRHEITPSPIVEESAPTTATEATNKITTNRAKSTTTTTTTKSTTTAGKLTTLTTTEPATTVQQNISSRRSSSGQTDSTSTTARRSTPNPNCTTKSTLSSPPSSMSVEQSSTSPDLNVSSVITTVSHADKGHTPGTTLVLFLGVICAVVAVGLISLYIWQKRKRSYIPCTCRACSGWCQKRMRSSSSASHGPLTMDDPTIDSEPRQERELFTIGDQDGGNDGRPSPRASPRARRSVDDDYYYDEMFERSAFVDKNTNKSNTHLTVDTDDDDDELDIPDLVFK